MNSNRYTILSSSAFSTYSNIWLGPRGNKRKNFRDREKWLEELNRSFTITETRLDPPSGDLWYMDFRA